MSGWLVAGVAAALTAGLLWRLCTGLERRARAERAELAWRTAELRVNAEHARRAVNRGDLAPIWAESAEAVLLTAEAELFLYDMATL